MRCNPVLAAKPTRLSRMRQHYKYGAPVDRTLCNQHRVGPPQSMLDGYWTFAEGPKGSQRRKSRKASMTFYDENLSPLRRWTHRSSWRKDFSSPPLCHKPPRLTGTCYIVFSGARRNGDIHSALLDLQPPDGTTLLPVSIDIVLSTEHCDLLNPRQQQQWLTWAMQGAIYMAIGGPPCETWSVARMRW